MRNGKKTIIFLLIGVSISTSAQQKTINRSNQQWLQYYAQMKLSKKWTFLADGGYRAIDNFQESVQYIARAGLDYTINPSIHVSFGFANLGFYSSGKKNKIEFRSYEELLVKNTFKKFGITHRFRVEERFFNPVVDGNIKSPGTFNFRFRYFFMASIPLFTLSKKNADKKILLNIGDEIFLNAGHEIVYNVFDQNRFIISPTLQFSKNFSISFTWNSQFASTTTQATYNYASVAWLQVRHRINFAHKKHIKHGAN